MDEELGADADHEDVPEEDPSLGSPLAMLGPLLWGFAYTAFFFMLAFYTPAYKEMFASMGVALPKLSVLVLNASDLLLNYWLILLPLATLLGGLSLFPYMRAKRKRDVVPFYVVGAGVLVLGMGLIWLSLQLPVWEMQRALGK